MADKFKLKDPVKLVSTRGKPITKENTGTITRVRSVSSGYYTSNREYTVTFNSGKANTYKAGQLDLLITKDKGDIASISRKEVTDGLNTVMIKIKEKTDEMKIIQDQIAFMDLSNVDELNLNLYKSYKIAQMLSQKEECSELEMASAIQDLMYNEQSPYTD
jgi:hypothetical protein